MIERAFCSAPNGPLAVSRRAFCRVPSGQPTLASSCFGGRRDPRRNRICSRIVAGGQFQGGVRRSLIEPYTALASSLFRRYYCASF